MKYLFQLKLAIIPIVAMMFCFVTQAAAITAPATDNDDSYKLPLFVPKVAQPAGTTKVNFDDKSSENDEIYTLPKRAAIKPSSLSPSSGQKIGDSSYDKQYQEYQRQMQLYNQQMVEYKKQLAVQQQTQTQQPGDNDTIYMLPGQYMPTKKNARPKPPRPANPPTSVQQQPNIESPTQAVASPTPQPRPQKQYQPPPAAQYNQKYNYSDQTEGSASGQSNNSFPNYYY